MNEFERYFEMPMRTSLQLSTMLDSELKTMHDKLARHHLMVQIARNFRDLRVKTQMREQLALIDAEMKKRAERAKQEKAELEKQLVEV